MKKAPKSWPTLPIAVWYPLTWRECPERGRSLILKDENNASFALQHPNRIREINLCLTNSLLLKTRSQVLASYPALEYLWLESLNPYEAPTVPVGFLGSSSPRLRHMYLYGVIFPSLPLLLSSARDLVSLRLYSIPSSSYFSPETLAGSLSTMTRLEFLRIHFLRLPASRELGSAGRLLAVRAVLPALTEFYFYGDRVYLERLISRIDSPILEQPFTPSTFETQELSKFTSHSSLHVEARQSFLLLGDKIFFLEKSCTPLNHVELSLISEDINSKAKLLHIFTRILRPFFQAYQVGMKSFLPSSPWLDPDKIDLAQWMDILCKLTKVTVFEMAGVFVQLFQSVLGQLPKGMVRRVLPALTDLHILGKCERPRAFESFARARRAIGLPITVHCASLNQ